MFALSYTAFPYLKTLTYVQFIYGVGGEGGKGRDGRRTVQEREKDMQVRI